MASLTGEQLKDTYDSLLKVDDNGSLGGTYKEITDGLGNGSNLYLGTGGNVGIGETDPDNPLHIKSSSAVLLNAECTGASSFIQLTNSGGASGIKSTGNELVLFTSTSGTERMRIDSSGNVTITTGNLILDSGAGIDFSDTPNSSGTMTSELLDDYEEGTWTPILGGGFSGSVTYTTQLGTYTKIGRQVVLQFYIVFQKNTLSGGSLQMQGLPFTSQANLYPESAILFDNLATALSNPLIQVAPNQSYADFVLGNGGTSTHSGLDINTYLGAGTMILSGTITYFV